MSKNKKKIKIKIKKARKVFATVVSRGPNAAGSKSTTDSEKNSEKEDDKKAHSDNKRIFSPLASFALCKQLDGTLDFEEGTTGWWSMRTAKGYGSVLQEEYDFSLENASKEDYKNFLRTPVPQKALESASKFRIGWYERLLNSNDIIRSLLYTPSAICFKIFNGIYKAPQGFVPMPKFWERSCGGHSVTIIGYDNQKQFLRFLNSWGKEWGDGGLGYLPYKYVDKYLIEAWAGMLDKRKNGERGKIEKVGELEFELLTYQSIIFGRQPLHVIDVYKNNKIVGWAHFRFDDLGHTITIEEIFVMPNFRKMGIGKQLLSQIEGLANKQFIPKIVCYIHAQDLLSEDNISAIENLFGSDKYRILSHTKKFIGCRYKIVGGYPF